MIMNNLFQRKHLVTNETEENNSIEEEHVSNGLENFGVEGETAPDLFSSDNETTETEGYYLQKLQKIFLKMMI